MTSERELSDSVRFPEVTLDEFGNPNGYRLAEVPVEPLTNEKIAVLPLAERAKILHEEQIPYSLPYLKQQFHHGLERTDPTTINLAAVIIDVKQRQNELDQMEQRHSNATANYEIEKQAIRSGKRGQRRIELKIREAAIEWQERNKQLTDGERICKILKDTVIDNFIHELFLGDNDVNRFLLATEDLVSQSSFTREDTLYLLQQASLRLRSREVHEDASFFQYKNGADNFIKEIDAKLLRQIVDIAFTDISTDNPNAWQLRQCSIDLLDFYWKNSRSLFGNEEKTPQLALINDIFYAGCLTGDLDVVEQVTNYVWSKLESGNTLGYIKKEYERLGTLANDALPAIIAEIDRDHNVLMPSIPRKQFFIGTSPEYLEKWNPELRRCRVEKNFDRVGDLNLIAELSSSLSGKRAYFSDWYPQEQIKMGLNYNKYFPYNTGINFIMNNVFPNTIHLPSLVQQFFNRKQDTERATKEGIMSPFDIPGNTQERQRVYSTARRTETLLSSSLRENFRANAVVLTLFMNLGIEDINNLRTSLEQNRVLFRQIRDKNLWFVAENGDQYSVDKNPELATRSIKSITFYPNSELSGWRIDIATELLDENFQPINITLNFDREGQFSLTSGARIKVPNWAKLPLERFILDRLHFITSGALGQSGTHKLTEGEKEVELGGRRSHWRTLVSTSDRIYTLTSDSAKRHAEYVLQMYGIDIYQENLRRRSVGTLGTTECVTFVKAVPKRTNEPNQIVYNPLLLEVVT